MVQVGKGLASVLLAGSLALGPAQLASADGPLEAASSALERAGEAVQDKFSDAADAVAGSDVGASVRGAAAGAQAQVRRGAGSLTQAVDGARSDLRNASSGGTNPGGRGLP